MATSRFTPQRPPTGITLTKGAGSGFGTEAGNSKRYRALPATLAAMLLCLTPSHAEYGSRPKYGLTNHCQSPSEFFDFEIWERANTIIVAHVSDDAEYNKEKWYEAEFQIEEVLLGDLKKGTRETIFAHIGGKLSRESLEAVVTRADLHDSPEFLPFRLTQFPLFGYASTGPEPEAECYPVPTVMKNIRYVFVLSGRKVLSAEPVLTQTDYWLRFLKALKEMHYWKRRAAREKSAGAED